MEIKGPKGQTPKIVPIAGPGERMLTFDCEAMIASPASADAPEILNFRAGDLSRALLDRLQPVHIVLPLFPPGGDVTLVIEELQRLGYGGRITILAPDLPRPRLVERELRAYGPGVRLTVLTP